MLLFGVLGVFFIKVGAEPAPFVLGSGCGVNNIPTYEENAKAKWSDVRTSTSAAPTSSPTWSRPSKAYARQEREVLDRGHRGARQARPPSRSRRTSSTIRRPSSSSRRRRTQLVGALGRLLAVAERYPDLKSNQNFLALQSQLEGTENRIAVARRDYIEAVRAYNTELRTFPGRDLGVTLYRSHKPMETFTVAEDVRRAPQVKF